MVLDIQSWNEAQSYTVSLLGTVHKPNQNESSHGTALRSSPLNPQIPRGTSSPTLGLDRGQALRSWFSTRALEFGNAGTSRIPYPLLFSSQHSPANPSKVRRCGRKSPVNTVRRLRLLVLHLLFICSGTAGKSLWDFFFLLVKWGYQTFTYPLNKIIVRMSWYMWNS